MEKFIDINLSSIRLRIDQDESLPNALRNRYLPIISYMIGMQKGIRQLGDPNKESLNFVLATILDELEDEPDSLPFTSNDLGFFITSQFTISKLQ
jgi:hypothetical protein